MSSEAESSGNVAPAQNQSQQTDSEGVRVKLFPNSAVLLACPSFAIAIALLVMSIIAQIERGHGGRQPESATPSVMIYIASPLTFIYITFVILAGFFPSFVPLSIRNTSRVVFGSLCAFYTCALTSVWIVVIALNARSVATRATWTLCDGSGCNDWPIPDINYLRLKITILAATQMTLMASIALILVKYTVKSGPRGWKPIVD